MQEFGEAEIEDLQQPVGSDADVSGFEIAVNDSLLMRRGQPGGELPPELQDFLFGNSSNNFFPDGRTGHVLHHQKIDAVLAVEIVNGADVGVIEPGKGESFLAELAARGIVGESVPGEDFQGDVAFEALIAGAINDAHSALANFLQDTVMTELLANHRVEPPQLGMLGRGFGQVN